MTKAELEIRVKELENELENCKHLSSAVGAKDNEMYELKEKHKQEIEKLKMQHELELEQLRKNKDKELENAIAQLNKRNETMSNDLQRRIRELNKLIDVYGNTLKGIQGQLDNAILINDYLINEVTG